VKVDIAGETKVKGDIIGNGLAVLAWRWKVINFIRPYFRTAIWVVARADSQLRPIAPSGDLKKDVVATKPLLKGKQVLGIRNTCLDPVLCDLEGVEPVNKEGFNLNDVARVLIALEADLAIMDVPDSLISLIKYPGKLKVLGVITENQAMAFGIAKDAPELLASFDVFIEKLQKNGTLRKLILRYYPGIQHFFSDVARE
jgi:ABC-type amino acid transport substrate-binding protein